MIGEVLRIAIAAMLALVLGRTFLVLGLVLPCRVASDSMTPTVLAGGRIVIDRTAFWLRPPRRWEVIVFRSPDLPRELCVKRIAGLPGERVHIANGVVYANGAPQFPPVGVRYGPRSGQELGDSPEYVLGADEYFVLGDNSLVSVDSRAWDPPGVRYGWVLGRGIVK